MAKGEGDHARPPGSLDGLSPDTFAEALAASENTLGHLTSLRVHHIFPKALLYQHGYDRSSANAVANFCFLARQTNLEIGKRPPTDYFAEVEAKHPGALASQ